ncbi:MAG: hypothetical protein ABI831_04805 [Betaproteobacteria bacterium]
MPDILVFTPGGYRYIKAVFQYSGGIAAEPGYEIERARFMRPLPLAEAFAAIQTRLKALGRPAAAFAACELRSPAPFTDQGFYDFNKVYVGTLARWGIYTEGGPLLNPVARTNVCPMYDKPAVPSMHAFSYTVPAPESKRGTFVIAGGGDAKESGPSYRDRIVRLGDTSPEGLREKALFVIAEIERRMQLLGFEWKDAVTAQIYTVQNVGHLIGELLAARGAAEGGVVWNYMRPPVVDLEFEMDVRGAAREIVL